MLFFCIFLNVLSRTMHPQLPIGVTVLKESDDLDILGEKFDSKMTFQ